jgi:hypothetical protein
LYLRLVGPSPPCIEKSGSVFGTYIRNNDNDLHSTPQHSAMFSKISERLRLESFWECCK